MPLTLSQYADYLDTRDDLSWPAPPVVEKPKANPYLKRRGEIRAVAWSVYGTLLAVSGGELFVEHPEKFIMDVALEKTLQEFKMWASMTRKPGQPAAHLRLLFDKALDEQRTAPSPGEAHPEINSETIWQNIVNKLLQKEFSFDADFFGTLNAFCRKVAYFFHTCLQTTVCYEHTVPALQAVKGCGLPQALVDNGQFFSPLQLQRALRRQDAKVDLNDFTSPELCVFSFALRARKPSERLFRQTLKILGAKGIDAGDVLYVGSSIDRDIVPAKRLKMQTALFAGDKNSLRATKAQLKDKATRPDLLLTELGQIAEVLEAAS